VQLEVIRLLVWPFRLAADYSPQAIPVRDSWTAVAGLAVVVTTALIALALALWRRAPALTFGILAGAATYLPTSNLLFTSGVVLADRALYVAALAPAVAAGWMLARSWDTPRRWAVAGALALVCVAFTGRVVTRIPFWRDTRSVVLQGFLEHPENFSNHVRLADAFLQTGDTARALAQYLVAGDLFDRYAFVPARAGQLALALRRPAFALELGRRAWAITPGHPTTARLLADVFLALHQPDSALAVAREAVTRSPGNLNAAGNYLALLDRTRGPTAVRGLAQARLDWLQGRLVAATSGIATAWKAGGLELSTRGTCWDLVASLPMLRVLASSEARALEASLAARAPDAECREAGAKVP
jgi:tetratricopeptide (TPR) repeat protein